MPDPVERAAERSATTARERWRELPARIEPEDWVTETPTDPPNPPEIGDPDRQFMLRYCML